MFRNMFFLDRNVWTLADPEIDMADMVMRKPDDCRPVRIRNVSQEAKGAQALKLIFAEIEIPLGLCSQWKTVQ